MRGIYLLIAFNFKVQAEVRRARVMSNYREIASEDNGATDRRSWQQKEEGQQLATCAVSVMCKLKLGGAVERFGALS